MSGAQFKNFAPLSYRTNNSGLSGTEVRCVSPLIYPWRRVAAGSDLCPEPTVSNARVV